MGPGTERGVDAIGRVRDAWLEALSRGDVESLVSMVTDDVVFLPPNSPPVVGKEQLHDLYANLFFASAVIMVLVSLSHLHR